MEPGEIYRPADFRRVYVDDQQELERVAAELVRSDAVGVDLEMGQRVERRPGGLQRWIHHLALIQLASDDLSVVVDPLKVKDLSPLKPLMAGPTRKVFLGGGQDTALLSAAGIPASNIADVGEVALGLFGRREDGMAALAHRIFGIRLDKTVRRTDWLVRPLHPALITYAHRDAELTLLIYRWFQRHHREALALHERRKLEASLPPSAPPWLRQAVERSAIDAYAAVMEAGLEPIRDRQQLSEDVRIALQSTRAPRLINRLLRLAGELELEPLLPDIVPYASSPSSLIRAAAARALCRVGTQENAGPVLEQLQQDAIEDVRKAATAALKELQEESPKAVAAQPEQEEDISLGDEALESLRRLKETMEDEAS